MKSCLPCAATLLLLSAVTVAPLSSVAAAPPAKGSKLDLPLVLTDGQRTIKRTRRELGFVLVSPTGPTAFKVELGVLKNSLERIAPAFHVDDSPARPVLSHGKILIKPGQYARALNIPTTAQLIAEEAAKNPAQQKFMVSVLKHPPALTPERLKGVTGIIGQQTTQTSPNPKRNHNIGVAVSFIDGALLSPGETFSLNGTVGKRTQAAGFRMAHVFENGEIVDGIGGGVSQVTGTLFNAAAKAGLKIVEVNPHSRPVAYLPLGYDATVAYGEKDLKFTNDTDAPIFVDYRFNPKNRHLTATLYGKKVAGKTVRLKANVQNLGPGKIDAQLYRIVKKNGKVVTKQALFDHHYRWNPKKKG